MIVQHHCVELSWILEGFHDKSANDDVSEADEDYIFKQSEITQKHN